MPPDDWRRAFHFAMQADPKAFAKGSSASERGQTTFEAVAFDFKLGFPSLLSWMILSNSSRDVRRPGGLRTKRSGALLMEPSNRGFLAVRVRSLGLSEVEP